MKKFAAFYFATILICGAAICFSCGRELGGLDLVPVFSLIFLGGHCRNCQAKIPVSAFVVDVLMGVLSVLAVIKAGILGNFQFSIFNFQLILIFDS